MNLSLCFPLGPLVWMLLLSIHPSTFANDDGATVPTMRKPNVVVFLTDDQGWGDLSVNGNVNLSTPNIDSLAKEGATLENFYVCAVCAPTRAEFLTGRYHPRTGVSGVSTGEERLNPEETTLAEVFRSAGYTTGAFGKWHNGTQAPYHPIDRGFDEFYGFTSGHWGHYFSPPLDHNGEKVRGNGFVIDDFTEHALEFIEKNSDRPFLCYLPYNTPHSPMMVDDSFYNRFKDKDPSMLHRDPEKEDLMMTRAALAMCENIDWNVGRVLEKLDSLGLSEETIVVYFSDNGPNSWRWNGGMKGRKGSLDEGGLRSPFFLRWPGHVKPGSQFDEVCGAIDLLPTLTQLAGIPLRTRFPLDGRSFSEMLTGTKNRLEPRLLFSDWKQKSTVRSDRFRMDAEGRLFDIRRDRGQTRDVSERFSSTVSQLAVALDMHRLEMSQAIQAFEQLPFTVGGSRLTVLPARDGIAHGTIRRSSKAPNNSFFEHWTNEQDSITWYAEIKASGIYEVVLNYTCSEGNTGCIIQLSADGVANSVRSSVDQAFDPLIYHKSKERVKKSHYFVKDFAPLTLGSMHLQAGRTVLSLTAPKITGEEAIDVHSIELIRQLREINPPDQPSTDTITAIVEGRMVDVVKGRIIDSATVLVQGNKILKVGASGEISIPEGADRIHAKGKTILPGLMDSHFHSRYNTETPVTYELERGITSFRDPGHPFHFYDPVKSFEGMMPRVFLCGGHLDGPPPVWPNQAQLIQSSRQARETVRAHAMHGASAIKIYFRLPLEHIRAACSEARRQGLPVTAHLELVDADAAIRAGVTGIEHVTSFGTALAKPEHVGRFKQAIRADSGARRQWRHRLWSTIDLSQSERLSPLIQLMKERNVVISPTLAIFERREGVQGGTAEEAKAFENMMRFIGICHQQGVKVVVGSHTSAPFADKGRAYLREVELLNACGMSPMEILMSATIKNAEFFGVSDRLGSIEEGKEADLILVRGNPLVDIRSLDAIDRVMLNGVWME